ncbi:hydrogenase expression/formation protein HypC [Azospirillum brasilense]|uniref:Hydrogenase expression/formation protein HypC n=1 Tax=Azospirillum brasilense TaxID=192 RepID=A0A560BC31_AZOBR|nr:HypC/HybG/HupF family hydrogenase formation chaperone [Azospirillum brasilense]TWA70039.1 hydrogenase expression/formation protein HypC [Azospirillum brasilense]
MCLAIPARVVEVLNGNFAIVEQGGVKTTISLSMVVGVSEGDYVAAHVGFAIEKLDAIEAKSLLALLTELTVTLPPP